MKHAVGILLMSLAGAQALAQSSEVIEFTTLAERRPQLMLPAYTSEERALVAEQVDFLMRELFVHREQKMSYYGPKTDPFPTLDRIVPIASEMPDSELHAAFAELFYRQRDFHTNYYLPRPYACYRAMLPFSLTEVRDTRGRPVVAVQSIIMNPRIRAMSPGIERLSKGDVLEAFDGLSIRDALRAIQPMSGGANKFGGVRAAIQTLTYRSQRFGLLPQQNVARLRFRDRQGRSFELELPWLSRAIPTCLKEEERKIDSPARRAENELQLEYQQFYRPPLVRVLEGEGQWNVSIEPTISYGKIENEYGSFGYLRLDSFDPTKLPVEHAISEIQRILTDEVDGTQGLIIDMRENGGGIIDYAESLAQLFTPKNIDPQGFRLLVSEGNRFFFEKSGWDPEFKAVLDEATRAGTAYTRPIPLSSAEGVNALGQYWFGPVAVLTNSGCYSSCDMFTALMQDFGIARIFGEDGRTGGGGANVVELSLLINSLPEDDLGPFAELPGQQEMRVAWRQTVRAGRSAGKLLEDAGVKADQVEPLTLADLYSNDSFLFRKVSRWLAKRASSQAPAFVSFQASRDVLAGQPLEIELQASGTDQVEFRQGGELLGKQSVAPSRDPAPLRLALPMRSTPAVGEVVRVELVGLRKGRRVWRRPATFRVVPEPVRLAEGETLELEFDGSTSPGVVYNHGSPGDAGWTVVDGRLRTGAAEQYPNNVRTDFSLFVDLTARSGGKLSFTSEMSTELDYDFFTVRAVAGGEETQIVGPLSGDHEEEDHEIDLTPWAGKVVELRFSFTSDSGITGKGVWLDDIQVEAK